MSFEDRKPSKHLGMLFFPDHVPSLIETAIIN